MKDENKTKAQLIGELNELRQRAGELEAGKAEPKPIVYESQESNEQETLLAWKPPQRLKGRDEKIPSQSFNQLEEQIEKRLAEVEMVNEQLQKEITERQQVEEALQKQTYDLGERVKELHCLYGISELVGRSNSSLSEILKGTVGLIPPSWQYPDITCARIVLEEQEFKTDNFNETPWKQSADITVHEKPTGLVEVYYLEEKPERDEGSFLKEERSLIDAISERLGRIVERKRAEEGYVQYTCNE